MGIKIKEKIMQIRVIDDDKTFKGNLFHEHKKVDCSTTMVQLEIMLFRLLHFSIQTAVFCEINP